MRKQCIRIILSALLAAVFAIPAWAQMATVKGLVTDEKGEPIAGATVEMLNKDNGSKYSLKTNKKGEYFSIGVQSGKYDINLMKDGKKLYFFTGVAISLAKDENVIDFNLKELAAQQGPAAPAAPGAAPGAPPAQTKGQPKLTPEQQKQLEEQRKQAEEIEKANAKIGGLNKLLAEAKAASDAGNYDQAVASLKQATEADPTRDLLWGQLGSYQNAAGKKATDPAARQQLYADAAVSLQKAVQICDQNPTSSTCKTQNGSYHNNLAQALVATGHLQEALAEYDKAAQIDPNLAPTVHFNEGAVLTNEAGRQTNPAQRNQYIDQANAAFDKAIAANPNSTAAWCEKGKNLIQKATYDAAGKITPAAGTVEALSKCVELDKTGQSGADAKLLLDAIGQTVQTSYGTNKKPAVKH
jgi:tetratricopeptide (TPR) repeat protein